MVSLVALLVLGSLVALLVGLGIGSVVSLLVGLGVELDFGIWIVPLCLASSGPRPVPVITRGVERSTRSVNRSRLYAMCSVDPDSIRNSLARPMVRVCVAIRLVAVVSGWSSGDW